MEIDISDFRVKCPYCDAIIKSGAKICWFCNHVLPTDFHLTAVKIHSSLINKDAKPDEASEIALKHVHNFCPICNKDDMIRKVSSITSSETALTTSQGGGFGIVGEDLVLVRTNQTGMTQSLLCERLAPPDKPKPESNKGLFRVLMVMGGGFLLFSFCMAMVTKDFAYGSMIFTWAGISAILLTIGIIGYGYEEKKINNILANENPKWEYVMKRWNELYYCGRDDIVFLQYTDKYSIPEHLNSLVTKE